MTRIMLAAAFGAFAFAMPAFAQGAATEQQITRIDEVLAAMTCEVDPDNVEVEGDGSFDLDDVICADGQYDITLHPDFSEAERRKE